ncbi:UNVERIFIED_CONTAM: hypothetical protein FKN15_075704 [Acipenser sinensis]
MDFTKGSEAPEKGPVEDTEDIWDFNSSNIMIVHELSTGNPPGIDHEGCVKETWNKDVWGREDANTDWRNKETEMTRARQASSIQRSYWRLPAKKCSHPNKDMFHELRTMHEELANLKEQEKIDQQSLDSIATAITQAVHCFEQSASATEIHSHASEVLAGIRPEVGVEMRQLDNMNNYFAPPGYNQTTISCPPVIHSSNSHHCFLHTTTKFTRKHALCNRYIFQSFTKL